MNNKVNSMSAAAFLVVIVGASLGGLMGVRRDMTKPEPRYARAVVNEVSAEYGMVTFVDNGGDLWVAEVEAVAGFECGDKYILTFDDMGTSDIYDDELIDIF